MYVDDDISKVLAAVLSVYSLTAPSVYIHYYRTFDPARALIHSFIFLPYVGLTLCQYILSPLYQITLLGYLVEVDINSYILGIFV